MSYQKIVVLTGAGISAESGLKTFRDNNGLWENHRVEEVATPKAFYSNPKLVYKFYNQRREQLLSDEVKENRGHLALAELEKKFDGEFVLITQNVDDLHERAGSKNVLHMHGELMKMRCSNTEEVYSAPKYFDGESICDCCQSKGSLRPHIVWFGEIPFYMDEIQRHLYECDLFVSIGTSGLVYPAAQFVQIAKMGSKCETVEINLNNTEISSHFDKVYQGPAGKSVDEFIGDYF